MGMVTLLQGCSSLIYQAGLSHPSIPTHHVSSISYYTQSISIIIPPTCMYLISRNVLLCIPGAMAPPSGSPGCRIGPWLWLFFFMSVLPHHATPAAIPTQTLFDKMMAAQAQGKISPSCAQGRVDHRYYTSTTAAAVSRPCILSTDGSCEEVGGAP